MNQFCRLVFIQLAGSPFAQGTVGALDCFERLLRAASLRRVLCRQPPDAPFAVKLVRLIDPVAEEEGTVRREGEADGTEIFSAGEYGGHLPGEACAPGLGAVSLQAMVPPRRGEQVTA